MSEDEESRLDRELIELLNELRVALPGVQILFAFLLTVPFNNRFERVTDLQKDVYFVALLLTLLSSALLMAPTAYHRLRWRRRDKEQMLQVANRLTIGGITSLAAAMTASVFFVTDFLFEGYAALIVTAAAAALFASFWFVLPLLREARETIAER